jgi:hypothetical protein
MARFKMLNGERIPFTTEEETRKDVEEKEWLDNEDNRKLDMIKEYRQEKLQETDWWVSRGNMTTEQSNYRQKLRDIPQDYAASDYDSLLEMEGETPNKKLKHTVWSKP